MAKILYFGDHVGRGLGGGGGGDVMFSVLMKGGTENFEKQLRRNRCFFVFKLHKRTQLRFVLLYGSLKAH